MEEVDTLNVPEPVPQEVDEGEGEGEMDRDPVALKEVVGQAELESDPDRVPVGLTDPVTVEQWLGLVVVDWEVDVLPVLHEVGEREGVTEVVPEVDRLGVREEVPQGVDEWEGVGVCVRLLELHTVAVVLGVEDREFVGEPL